MFCIIPIVDDSVYTDEYVKEIKRIKNKRIKDIIERKG